MSEFLHFAAKLSPFEKWWKKVHPEKNFLSSPSSGWEKKATDFSSGHFKDIFGLVRSHISANVVILSK